MQIYPLYPYKTGYEVIIVSDNAKTVNGEDDPIKIINVILQHMPESMMVFWFDRGNKRTYSQPVGLENGKYNVLNTDPIYKIRDFVELLNSKIVD